MGSTFRFGRRLLVYIAAAGAIAAVTAVLFPQLGWNLVAEWIGLCFGLFVVDKALKDADAARRKPAVDLALKDAANIYAGLMSLCRRAITNVAKPSDAPWLREGIETNLSQNLAKVMERNGARLPGKDPGAWALHFEASRQMIDQGVERFLVRYSSIADPALLPAVHEVADSRIIRDFRAVDDYWFRTTWWMDLMAATDRLGAAIRNASPPDTITNLLDRHHYVEPGFLAELEAARAAEASLG